MVALFSCDGGSARAAQPSSMTLPATAAPVDKAPPGLPKLPPLPPLPPRNGERLLYRFTDHAGEAQLDLLGSSLSARFAAFDSPYKLVSPYSGLRGETALRVIEVAVADAAVEKYPRDSASAAAATGSSGPVSRFDPVWNRYRGVYESKLALLAPAPACYRFHLDLGHTRRAELSFFAAAIPSQQKPGDGVDVEFLVTLDEKPLYRTRTSRKDATLGRWLPARINLPLEGLGDSPRHELALCTSASGTPAGTAVWGNPELWAEQDDHVAPNLLLVLIDTLRADALPAMPRLGAYARDAVSFTQAISAATWTRPSLLGILGGDLPTAIGQSAEEMIPSERERKRFYALDRRLLPRLLRDAGYKVASIGNNFFLLGYPQIGLSLGFDEVADVRHPVEDSPAITRAALAFLQKNQRRPFFLQLHYDAPHWPYTPPPEYLRGISDALAAQLGGARPGAAPGSVPGSAIDPQARAYLGEAAYADAQVAIVLDELKRLGLQENTLVVVLGDHGEVFDAQHNHFVQALRQPTLYHHGWSAYDEILRVPLVLAMPGRLPRGVEIKSQVRLIDVTPTVLDLLGLGTWRSLLPSGTRSAAQSLLPLLYSDADKDSAERADRPAFAEGQNIRALRSGGYLYLRRGDPRLQRAQGNDGIGSTYRISEELYDLHSDPQQHHDLLNSRDTANTAAVQQTLLRLREEFARYAPQPPEQGLPLTHLFLAPDARAQHMLTGTLFSSDPAFSVQGVRSGEVIPRGLGRLEFTLRPGGSLDVLADPAARLELTLFRDGLALGPRELLLGPFSLPLIAAGGPLVVEGLLLDRLSASYPPVPGERGEVLLWRDQAAPGMSATATTRPAASASEVATLMRDWGYARADAPTDATPRPADGGTAAAPSAKP